MRNAKPLRAFIGRTALGLKASVLAVLVLGLAPVQAQAAETCNAAINIYGVDGPPTFFEGDTLTLKATIGAGRIRDSALTGEGVDDNPFIDFTGLGYGLDCGGDAIMDSLSDCRPVGGGVGLTGHDIEFLGVTDTTCLTENGDPALWPPFESNNIVAVPVLNGVIRQFYKPKLDKGETCNVDVSFVVKSLHESTNWVTQALGVPFDNDTPGNTSDDMLGSCSNGLGAGDYAKATFQVQSCDILVTKEVSLDGEVWVDAATAVSGQDVYYRVLVENTGTAPLVGNAVVNDVLLSVEDQTVDVDGLNPGEVLIIDGGKIANFDTKADCEVETTVTNTAGVEAWCRGSDGSELEISSFMEDTAALTCTPPPPSIDLVKTADPLIYNSVGDEITYSFTVTNDGNVALANVGVVDPLPRLSAISCPQTELAVAEQMVCTATYLIDQADLNATFVNNTATATGTSPSGQTVQDMDSATISTTPRYSLGLVKTADPQFYESDGEDIGYSYELTNTGNQTLYPPYAVSDDKTTVQCPGVPAMLNPGDSVTCTATYTTTVTDVSNRSVTNVAQGSAQNAPAEGATILSNTDEETVVYRGIELSAAGICVNDVPWVEYSFNVYGFPGYQPSDVTYTWVNVDDPGNPIIIKGPLAFTAISGHLLWPDALATGPAGPGFPADGDYLDTWPDGIAWPGWTEDPAGSGNWSFVDTPAIPQLELRAQINPTDVVVVSYPDATPNCSPPAEITVDKTVLSVTPVDGSSVDVAYKVSVSNTGGKAATYDLYDVLMADEAFTASSIQAPVTYAAGSENDQSGDITPGLTADDFTNGATIVTGETLEAGLDEGFTFTLRFSIDELLVTAEGANCDKDDDEGGRTGLTNHVDVLVDDEVVDEAEACGELPLTPSIAVLKEIRDGEAWLPADTPETAPVRYYPSSAEYRIVVKNTGPVDLQNVVVSDAKVGLVDYPVNGGFLAAWQEVTIGVSTEPGETDGLLVAEACDDSGDFPNTAEVDGVGTIEAIPVSDSDMAYLACVGKPGVTVLKEVSTNNGQTFHDASLIEVDGDMVISDPAGPIEVGDGAIYRITVTNSGQVDLVDIEVDDSMILNGPFEIALLEVGDSVVVDEGDWPDLNVAEVCGAPGTFKNVADVVAYSDEWDGDSDTDSDDANVVCIGDPSIEILKEVSIDDGVTWDPADAPPFPTAVVDDTAETALYRIIVRNPDDEVALVNVRVDDDDLGIDYLVGALAPLEEVVLVAAGYGEVGQIELAELTVPDICGTRGEKVNLAVATGQSEAGAPAEDQDSATVDCVDEPKIMLVKMVSADGVNFSPDSATGLIPSDAFYRFEVTNTGSVALENVTVSDPILGVTISVGTLAVGETKVVSHVGPSDVVEPDLHVPGFCGEGDEGSWPNTALAYGESVTSDETAEDEDSALMICAVPVDICEENGGRPGTLKLQYNGTTNSSNAQGEVAAPPLAAYPVPVTIELYDKSQLEATYYDVVVGDLLTVRGRWTNSGYIPPDIGVKFYDDAGNFLQAINFHGSCSAPLNIGDKYAGVTIVGYTGGKDQ